MNTKEKFGKNGALIVKKPAAEAAQSNPRVVGYSEMIQNWKEVCYIPDCSKVVVAKEVENPGKGH